MSVLYSPTRRKWKKATEHLTKRASQVWAFLRSRKVPVTAAQLQAGLKVNRNVIAGAMYELRQHKLIRSEPLHMAAVQTTVAATASPPSSLKGGVVVLPQRRALRVLKLLGESQKVLTEAARQATAAERSPRRKRRA